MKPRSKIDTRPPNVAIWPWFSPTQLQALLQSNRAVCSHTCPTWRSGTIMSGYERFDQTFKMWNSDALKPNRVKNYNVVLVFGPPNKKDSVGKSKAYIHQRTCTASKGSGCSSQWWLWCGALGLGFGRMKKVEEIVGFEISLTKDSFQINQYWEMKQSRNSFILSSSRIFSSEAHPAQHLNFTCSLSSSTICTCCRNFSWRRGDKVTRGFQTNLREKRYIGHYNYFNNIDSQPNFLDHVWHGFCLQSKALSRPLSMNIWRSLAFSARPPVVYCLWISSGTWSDLGGKAMRTFFVLPTL